MKKFSKKTGKIMGKISLLMIFCGIIFIGFMFTKWGWWFDVMVFGPVTNALNISRTVWFWFLRCYVLAAVLLAVLAGYFSED